MSLSVTNSWPCPWWTYPAYIAPKDKGRLSMDLPGKTLAGRMVPHNTCQGNKEPLLAAFLHWVKQLKEMVSDSRPPRITAWKSGVCQWLYLEDLFHSQCELSVFMSSNYLEEFSKQQDGISLYLITIFSNIPKLVNSLKCWIISFQCVTKIENKTQQKHFLLLKKIYLYCF